MPHLTLEHSANMDSTPFDHALLCEFHQILHDIGGIPLGNCKSRVLSHARFAIAGGDPGAAFVHLGVAFLEGRSPEVRHAIGEALLERLRDASGKVDGRQVTVEIRQMAAADYFKWPAGTLRGGVR